jgi:xanthine dehydrogenase accessory factor
MELRVLSEGRGLLEGDPAPPRIQRLVHRKEGDGERSGLICAGSQTNLYARLDAAEHLDVINAIVDAVQSDRADGLEISPEGIRLLDSPALGIGIQRTLERTDDGWRYRELTMNLSRLAIFGGGHCGRALSRLMNRLGYHVAVFDTRPDVHTLLENDSCHEKHVVDDFILAGALVRVPTHTEVVVMTTELTSDIRALIGLIGRPFPFIGVMGSRAKIAAIRKALLAEMGGSALSERLVAPVGLAIGSNTPDEIAVSVAAQLLERRSARSREDGS